MFQNIINQIIKKPQNRYVNYEDLQQIQTTNTRGYFFINTLPYNEQTCLIRNTVAANEEENLVNVRLKNAPKNRIHFFIYGRNSSDQTVGRKYSQLTKMGYTNVFIYSGGLFEWLLLQDIYGEENFPTTSKELNILKYKQPSFMKNTLMNF